jgi:two-component system, OmpR family, sensor histidine kinase KdpD
MYEGRGRSLLLRDERPPLAIGVVASIASVAVTTALIYPLKSAAPAVSLGVVYLVAVLLVSALWGMWLGVLTAILSGAAFNFFHLPPTGEFTIASNGNWVALVAFVLVAVVTSSVADIARARAQEAERGRREADLAAALARALLAADDTAAALPQASARVADALGVSEAQLVLGTADGDRRRDAVPLRRGEEQIATLLVPIRLDPEVARRMHEQVVSSLEALIAIALQRDAIQDEVVQTSALRRSDDLKTAILRSVSHDLRTPLTAMLTAGHALGSPSLTAEERRDLSEAIVDEGERLSVLVDKLLDLSKLQSGRAQPRPEWTSLDEVLLAAAESAGVGRQMRMQVDPGLPPLRADAAQLERAFANVLENAARHSAGHPVSVRARHVGQRLLVRVVDRGPGISEPERERVFEPFHRSPGDDSRHGGAGLGLAIARGFIEANGGSIWIESPPGQGTSFVVAFPIEAEAEVKVLA